MCVPLYITQFNHCQTYLEVPVNFITKPALSVNIFLLLQLIKPLLSFIILYCFEILFSFGYDAIDDLMAGASHPLKCVLSELPLPLFVCFNRFPDALCKY